jgi:hypothetical protein
MSISVTVRVRPSARKALYNHWREKCQGYINNGRWQVATKGEIPIPLLLVAKPRKSPDDSIRLRARFDQREQNADRKKQVSQLPNQGEVLDHMASHKKNGN